jgi:RNA polymerase sigma-70 factor (ECF subfamily)
VPIHRLSDSRLIRRSQQGDRDAFVALVQRYDDRLRGLTYTLVAGDDAAERMSRVLRVAYLKAWRDVVRADPDDDAGAWIYRIVYNACIDDLRRENPRPSDGPAAGRLVGALGALPPEQRVVVVLVDREGFSRSVASRIVGVDQDTFDARLVEARSRLARPARRAVVARRRAAAARRSGANGARPDGAAGRRKRSRRSADPAAPGSSGSSGSSPDSGTVAPEPSSPSPSPSPSPDPSAPPSPDAGPALEPPGSSPDTAPPPEATDLAAPPERRLDPPLAAAPLPPPDARKPLAEMPRPTLPGTPGALPQIPAAAQRPPQPPGPGSVRG